MICIQEDSTFTQIVRFDVEPSRQRALIAVIVSEVERWVRHCEGFVSSSFHASDDGREIVNYAQWRSETDFREFTRHSETAALQAAIKAVDAALKPHAIHCHVVRAIEKV